MNPIDIEQLKRLQKLIVQYHRTDLRKRRDITKNALTQLAAQNNYSVQWHSLIEATLINNTTGQKTLICDLC